jgi:hypothetical protein
MLNHSKCLLIMSTSFHTVFVADAHLAEGQFLHNSIQFNSIQYYFVLPAPCPSQSVFIATLLFDTTEFSRKNNILKYYKIGHNSISRVLLFK